MLPMSRFFAASASPVSGLEPEEASTSGRRDDVPSGAGNLRSSLLWSDKYAPATMADLAVHKKKVEEVKTWLSSHLTGGLLGGSNVLLLTGPPGAGKSALVRVLARSLGCQLCEWNAPVPTLWNEFKHTGGSGLPFVSKMDEFEAFLHQAELFPSLAVVKHVPGGATPSSTSMLPTRGLGGFPPPATRKLVLIEDLPLAHDAERRERLAQLLRNLARTSRFPTIVCITDSMAGQGGGVGPMHRACEGALELAGAAKITFNPITAIAIAKVLTRVASAEHLAIRQPEISALAEGSRGDLRAALLGLQFHFQREKSPGKKGSLPSYTLWENKRGASGGQRKASARDNKRRKLGASATGKRQVSTWAPGGEPSSTASALEGQEANNNTASAPFPSCDGVLSLFHALGKFLHNKRVPESALDGDEGTAPAFRRQQLSMESPETVLLKSHSDTGTIIAFLHENFLQFVSGDDEGENGDDDNDVMDDVVAATGYMSDAEVLLNRGRWMGGRGGAEDSPATQYVEADPGRVAAAASGSVVARGILFSNMHPAPRRWQALRAPVSRQVERSSAATRAAILRPTTLDSSIFGTGGMVSSDVVITEIQPFRKRMFTRRWNMPSHNSASGKLPWPSTSFQGQALEETALEDGVNFALEDDTTERLSSEHVDDVELYTKHKEEMEDGRSFQGNHGVVASIMKSIEEVSMGEDDDIEDSE